MAPMNSRLYECRVLHARFHPKQHRFAYRLFLVALDLDELPALHHGLHLFSVNRPNLFSVYERDYLPIAAPLHNPTAVPPAAHPAAETPQASGNLKSRVLAYLAHHGIDPGPGARIELVTMPRLFGYVFNPVSFYFAYNAQGDCVAAITEVTNTFREMKPYLLGPEHRLATREAGACVTFQRRTPKHFYVSPFSALDVAFDFQLRVPAENLFIQIDDYVGPQRTLTSHLVGPTCSLSDTHLAWFTLKYPLVTLRVITLIHWHALRLFLKKIPVFRKNARPADQRDLYHPHVSLSPATPSSPAHPAPASDL